MGFSFPTIHLIHLKLTHPPNFGAKSARRIIVCSIYAPTRPSALTDVGGGCDPYFKVIDGTTGECIYNMKKDKSIKIRPWRKEKTFEVQVDIKLHGDFKIVFYDEVRRRTFHCVVGLTLLMCVFRISCQKTTRCFPFG
jgi:hypothetical protein